MSEPPVGFGTRRAGERGEVAEIGVGMLGHAFMGRAHSSAYRAIAALSAPPPLEPRLVAIAGRDAAAVGAAARRYGFAEAVTDWRELVADERIALFDDSGPNDAHAEPTMAAARAGKHVLCEKPLGRDAAESYEMWRCVADARVTHMCAFNYRFVPAVRLAREMIEAGDLGDIRHFRCSYLQDWLVDPDFDGGWRMRRAAAGSGALGDLGAHAIDLARFLVGEITAVSALTRTFIAGRPSGPVDVDDAFVCAVEFEGAAVGTIEASRFALGRKNRLAFEINGSKGSVAFDLERLNELEVHLAGSRPGEHAQGFRRVLVTEHDQPFMDWWWPPGHIIGWEHTFVHEIHHLLRAIASGDGVHPYGADFEDGYRAAEVCDAILRSSGSGRAEAVTYRTL